MRTKQKLYLSLNLYVRVCLLFEPQLSVNPDIFLGRFKKKIKNVIYHTTTKSGTAITLI